MRHTRGLGQGGLMGTMGGHEKYLWLHMERNQRPLPLMFIMSKVAYCILDRINVYGSTSVP